MFLVVFYITIKITEYGNLLLIPENNPKPFKKEHSNLDPLWNILVYPDCETAHALFGQWTPYFVI